MNDYSNKNWSPKSWRNNKKNFTIQTKKTQKEGKKWYFSFFSKNSLIFFSILIGFTFISLIAGYFYLTKNLPDPNNLIERKIAQSTKIYDRTGETVLYEVHGEERRTMVKLNDIPEFVKQATIAIEDKDFYKHGGFSLWAIFRTVVTNVVFGKKAGGSTLTQQLIKNAVLTNEKSYIRKAKELILAYRLEKKFSKDEILQMYFNEIPYGSNAYGVEAASQKYFGKSANDLNLAEGAILAALPQAPSRYSPYGSHKNLLLARQKYIIDLMVKYGYIDEIKAEEAKNTEIKFKNQVDNITAPHFVMYIKELLADKYGQKAVEQDGLKIYTTLDLYKQKAAEEAISSQVEKNEKRWNASNAALVSIDPKTGQILAMVGSKNYFDEKIDGQVNIATALRQPGSSIKPIVYTAAFMKGFTPNTVLYDVVTNFAVSGKSYEPHNYNGKEYGPITMRKALAGSLNTPAVKTLYLAGIDKVIKFAKNLGYTSLDDAERFGLSLVLGGGEVKLLEHTNAYSAIARDGYIRPVKAILKIEDKDGKVLEEFKDEPKNILDANIAHMTADVMSDNNARSFIFGEKNYLTLGSRPVAAKTGTTNDNRDAWTIGFTPSLIAGVWVGNNNNTPMKAGADGSVVAAPIWNNYMKKVLGDTPIEYFKKPNIPITGKPVLDGTIIDGIKIKIDKASGLLATEQTPPDFIEEKTYKETHCILYYINKDNPLGDPLKTPGLDPQFNLWESRVLRWAAKNNITTSTPPTEKDNIHINENLPTLKIISPTEKETISTPVVNINIEATAARNINRVEYYIDNNLAFTNSAAPFNFEKNLSFLKNGFHDFKIKACDDVENCTNQTITLNLTANNNISNNTFNLSWNKPTLDLNISSTTLPLSLEVNSDNLEQTAKITFLVNDKIIKTVSLFIGNPITITWTAAPGTYKIRAFASGWNGQTAETKTLNIIIK